MDVSQGKDVSAQSDIRRSKNSKKRLKFVGGEEQRGGRCLCFLPFLKAREQSLYQISVCFFSKALILLFRVFGNPPLFSPQVIFSPPFISGSIFFSISSPILAFLILALSLVFENLLLWVSFFPRAGEHICFSRLRLVFGDTETPKERGGLNFVFLLFFPSRFLGAVRALGFLFGLVVGGFYFWFRVCWNTIWAPRCWSL